MIHIKPIFYPGFLSLTLEDAQEPRLKQAMPYDHDIYVLTAFVVSSIDRQGVYKDTCISFTPSVAQHLSVLNTDRFSLFAMGDIPHNPAPDVVSRCWFCIR